MSPPYFTVTVLSLLLSLLNLVGRNLALDNDGACPYPCNQPPLPPYPLYGYPPPPPPSGYPLYFPPQPRPRCPPFSAECCHSPPPPYPYVFPPPGAYEPLGGGGTGTGTGGGTTACAPTVAIYALFSYVALAL